MFRETINLRSLKNSTIRRQVSAPHQVLKGDEEKLSIFRSVAAWRNPHLFSGQERKNCVFSWKRVLKETACKKYLQRLAHWSETEINLRHVIRIKDIQTEVTGGVLCKYFCEGNFPHKLLSFKERLFKCRKKRVHNGVSDTIDEKRFWHLQDQQWELKKPGDVS